MNLKKFEEEIEKLNAPEIIETEKFSSLYDFTYKVQTNSILIFDRNENFHINVDDEIRCIMRSAAQEFGFEYKTPASTEERIIGLFKSALEKDLNKPVSIEWQDPVCLIANFE